MTLLNEIESTGEQDVNQVVVEAKDSIITDAHAFFDLAKSRIEHVIEEVIARAGSVEEALETTILSAFGHAAETSKAVETDEVASS